MKSHEEGTRAVIKLMFRVLPIQILLAAVGGVNGIVSSYFASNFVGIDAMSAVGVYFPLNTMLTAISTMLSGGSAILCGKYLGRNDQEKVRSVFSLNLLLATGIAGLFAALFVLMGSLNLTGFLSRDPAVQPLFNTYLLGQAIGVVPFVLGNQLPVYLSMETKQNRTLTASLAYIAVNVALNFLFVQVLHLEAFGLALASALGLWVFLGVQASYFLSGKSKLRLRLKGISPRESFEILRTGLPGAASSGYQTIRGIILNNLLEVFVGSVGISAFATANNLLAIFWGIPNGMLAVSRLMISVAVGEEDRQTLVDVMRNMFRRFVPLMCCVSALIILCADPLTRIFYQDPASPVFAMTAWGFRILPLCMPLSIICVHFICFGQTMNQQVLVHTLALLDGVVCVAGFSALLIGSMGLNGVYVANVLNGVVCVLAVMVYAWARNKRFPRTVEDMMVIPADFGVRPEDRIDISVRSIDEVLMVSKQVAEFCRRRGIDGRRAYLSGLCLEEMAGNIVEHGFRKDSKKHSVDIRVAHKADEMILRIRDDCVPFDPKERNDLTSPADKVKNMGIRMVYKAAKDVEYQSVLGLNVLTIRI